MAPGNCLVPNVLQNTVSCVQQTQCSLNTSDWWIVMIRQRCIGDQMVNDVSLLGMIYEVTDHRCSVSTERQLTSGYFRESVHSMKRAVLWMKRFC